MRRKVIQELDRIQRMVEGFPDSCYSDFERKYPAKRMNYILFLEYVSDRNFYILPIRSFSEFRIQWREFINKSLSEYDNDVDLKALTNKYKVKQNEISSLIERCSIEEICLFKKLCPPKNPLFGMYIYNAVLIQYESFPELLERWSRFEKIREKFIAFV